MMKKIVVASDSFKGSLSSSQVAEAAAIGIHSVFPDCEVVGLSVADGGEGTVSALVDTLGGSLVEAVVSDPLGRPVTAVYGIVPASCTAAAGTVSSSCTAVIEMSAASGLPLLSVEERNPSLTSTYGTGELIRDALSRGCRRFLVGIGGSATNDAGTGMLSALGFRFLDASGQPVHPCGGTLSAIAAVDSSQVPDEVRQSEFIVACDVDTPFCGPSGAAYVFAPQKGAGPEMVRLLDDGLSSFAEVISGTTGKDFRDVPGTGAAGGLGGGFAAFLDATLQRGVDMVLDAIRFDERLAGADLVITGEGKIDSQTSKGKTPQGVLERASRQGIPVIAIGGCVDTADLLPAVPSGFSGVFPIVSGPVSLEEAMLPEIAYRNVVATVSRIMKLIASYVM